MKIQNSQFLSLEQIQNQYRTKSGSVQKNNVSQQNSFQNLLEQIQDTSQDSEVKFSKHAANRLNNRNIELTNNQIQRLKEGTKKAEAKGIQDSLVLIDQLAFIVNIPSNTVVTAMNQNETNDNVFTNIDGAVII